MQGFTAASGSDWAETAEIIDDDTNELLSDIDGALIELQVQDSCQRVVLKASSADGSISKPATGTFTWRFSVSQMAALPSGNSYKVAARMTLSGVVSTLFLTDLVVEELGFTWQ